VGKIHFTADTHFGHMFALTKRHRPFSSLEAMDEFLIARWNEAVRATDEVYHLGDVAHVEPGGKIIDVAGNVRLEGQSTEHAGTAVVRTDALSYDVPSGVASTRSDVRIEFGAHTLTARGLVANLKERTMRLESKVNGHFQP